MAISPDHLKLRAYIHQVVNDPQYKEIAAIPLISWPQMGLIALSFLCVFGGIFLFLTHSVSLWILYPFMVFGFYTAFTPLHDATHRALSSNKFLNDLLGTVSAFLLFPFANTAGYRYIHMTHHRYVGDQDLDPDELLVGLPTHHAPWGYAILFIPDLTWIYWLFAKVWKRTPAGLRFNILGMIVGNIAFHLFWFLGPYAYEYLLLFFIPNRLGIAYVAYAFAHIQHGDGEIWEEHPFQASFKIQGNGFYLRSLWGQANHHLHHFLPHIPWYKYKRTLELANGVFNRSPIPLKKAFEKPDKHFLEKVIQGKEDVKEELRVRVSSILTVGPAIKSIVFEALEGGELPEFTAGSHIHLTLPSGKVRAYSLVNPPFDRSRYQIAVKYEPNGRGGSKEIHEQISVGDTLWISPPQNNFLLYEQVQKYVLIAGGIGLTPLLAMAHRLTELEKHFELHICAKTREDIPFSYELENWTFAPHVSIHIDKHGKASLPLPRVLAGPNDDTLIYVCGPLGFNHWVKNGALDLGWPAEQIKQEIFSIDAREQKEPKAFELVLQKSGKSLIVEKDLTIIDSLLLNHIKVAYSCLQGTCGTCIASVIDGEVDHRDAVLSEEERLEGKKICLCVSRSKGNRLIIDI